MPVPTITALPAPPLRSESPATFSGKAEAWVAALAGFTSELNAFADYLVATGALGGAVLIVSATEPVTAEAETLWWDTTVGRPKIYHGGAWVEFVQEAATSRPFSLGTFMVDNTQASQVLLDYVFTFAGSFPDDFANSQIPPPDASPAATWTASVRLNGAAIGSISVSTSGVVTKSTIAGAVPFTAGSRLRIIGPAVADASINGLAITLEGTL